MELTRKIVIQNLNPKSKAYVIPNDVTYIGADAFHSYTSLKSITIPEGVTNIGNYAFCNCKSLENITIPESVTNIGTSAFYGCTSLRSIIIPKDVIRISDAAFHSCTSLKNIIIPKDVTYIGNHAFNDCISLPVLGVGKILLEEIIKRGDYSRGLCPQLSFLISEFKYPTCAIKELPCFTKENAIKYCNGIDDSIWFSCEKDREKFVHWMLKELNKS